MIGIQESARANAVIVVIKVTVVIVVFIGVGLVLHQPGATTCRSFRQTPARSANSASAAIMRAAGVIFFAYIGFDAVSTAAQEAKNPQRDMPIGIIGSLIVCTILYVLFSHGTDRAW